MLARHWSVAVSVVLHSVITCVSGFHTLHYTIQNYIKTRFLCFCFTK
ncbi:unnamed protein product [Plutella xylostella]|uniref:(diamondback moth) hypothetical protein n=1 Tax=Plutella xylostella TaxID=51655 RepID=A0A8S4FHF7_PLUXY|nr:unnamed protein product [Plutella xylostella]